MNLDADAAYQALRARDARFDGLWFVGVKSTRIYCRPICRVRLPRRENCRFFDTPAQAEAAAFRPWLKCRPEMAPGPGLRWSVMDASRTLAMQAAEEIERQAACGETPSMARAAQRLGVSDRHLRRIFAAEHGVTPLQHLQTRRLLLAKQLLTDTHLPIAQVALAAGFQSLRRFNAAFAQHYRLSPSRLRGDTGEEASPQDDSAVAFKLGFREPFDVKTLLRFLEQRAIPGIETIDGLDIRRTVRAGSVAPTDGWVQVSFEPEAHRVQLRFASQWAAHSGGVIAAVRRWLDLDAAPQAIASALADLPGKPGQRLPGGLDAFELAVRAVLGQQVTVAAARTLAGRVVERFGDPLATPWDDIAWAFPAPQRLAESPPEHIAQLGIIRTRAQAIVALARAWPDIEPCLHTLASPQALIERLCGLPGIGPWTAHYVAMRALGWPDAFPPNDVALLKAMKRQFGTTSQRDADTCADAWRPWRAYAVLRLWSTLETSP